MQLTPVSQTYSVPLRPAALPTAKATVAEPGDYFITSTSDVGYHYNSYTMTNNGTPIELEIRLPNETTTHSAWYDGDKKDVVYHADVTSTGSPTTTTQNPMWDFLINPKG